VGESRGFDPGAGFWAPNFGFAYRLPKSGPLSWLTGDGVFRGGFGISTNRQGIGFLDGIWSGNAGRSLATSTSPSTTPTVFTAGGVLLSDAVLPSLAPTSLVPSFPKPTFPLAVQSGQNVTDYNPNIKPEYVESWTIGLQRPLGKNTVMEVRYVGNHGVGLWANTNLNEINIVENHFIDQFKAAQNNLAIANGISVAQLLNPQTRVTNLNFGSTGLPGQVAVPILTTALGTSTDQTTATQLQQGQAGATANGIANNATRMGNLTKAGFPVNLFQVNPNNGGAANLLGNRNSSTYNSLQIEVRRRLSAGLQVQGSYAFSKSLTNSSNPTLRDWGGEKGPATFDIRHGIKATWIYELPFGRGKALLGGSHGVIDRIVGGWELAGVGRLQSGTPTNFNSGRATFNQNDSGVVLHNMTTKELQEQMALNFRSQINANGSVTGTAYYLPQPFIANTLAAFNVSGTLDPNAPYLGPCDQAGQLCNRVFIWGPWLSKWDVSMIKRTRIRERFNVEFRAQALNVFNHPNILSPGGAATNGNIGSTVGSNFGQTTAAFRDFNNTNDPGGRTLEFVLRLNF
jgi:hypothetical protein